MSEKIIPQDTTPQASDETEAQRKFMPPEAPRIFPMPGGFELRWSFTDCDISAYVTKITEKATAEVSFYYASMEQIRDHKETLLLAPNRVDFLAPNQKYSLAKQLYDIGHTDEFLEFVDWERKVNNIALAVINTCRQNIPALEIRADPNLTLKAEYVVEPILYKDLPNIIFGDYSSLKSIMVMVLAYIAQLPYTDNGLGLEPADREKPTPVLWLDYEGQGKNFQKQWTGIQRGFHKDLEVPILYKEMTAPLADSIEGVREDMAEHHIKMSVTDSLGPAAGGNLNDPEPAIRYHQALRSLGGTNVTIAHNSKDPNTGNKSIFGSVFFSNLARSIWQVKADKDPMSNIAVVSLKQIKASLSMIHAPIGLVFEFDEQASIITVTKTDLQDTGLAGELPLSLRIKEALKRGPKTANELEIELEAKEGTLRVALNRLKKLEVTLKIGDQWALRQP